MAAGTRRATIMASWPAPLVMDRGLRPVARAAAREHGGERRAHRDGGLIDRGGVGGSDGARCGSSLCVVHVVADSGVANFVLRMAHVECGD